MTTKTLVCCALPFGYGPVAKLMLIAQSVQSRGLRPVFLGTGIAHELAVRSRAFYDIVSAPPGDRRARAVLDSSCGLVSLMDRDYAGMALELSKPIYVADSLFWMRDQVPEVFRRARRYWVQNFAGVGPQISKPLSNAAAVGPIVQPMSPLSNGRGTKLVVNLGGCESPHGSAVEDSSYVDFVVGGIVASELPHRFEGRVALLAGSRCVEHLRQRYPDDGIEFFSVSHENALSHLQSAKLVLTSPGLTTSLECFQLVVPTFFLPPQNYSQWCILKHFRRNELACNSFHWEDFLPDWPAQERMPESSRTPQVRRAICDLVSEVAVVRSFRELLGGCLSADHVGLARRQRKFFESLGPNGVEQIAADLAQLC